MLVLGFVIAAVFLAKNILVVFKKWLMIYFLNRVRIQWQGKIFDNYLSNPYQFFVINDHGILIQKLLEETRNAAAAIKLIIEVCSSLFIGLFIYIVLLIASYKTTMLLTGFTVLVGIVSYYLSKKKFYLAGVKIMKLDQMSYSVASQTIAGIRQVKAFAVEKFFSELFRKKISGLVKLRVKYATLNSLPLPCLETFVVLGISTFIVVIASSGDLSRFQKLIPAMAVFVAAIYRLMPLVSNTSSYIMSIGQYLPSINVVAGLVHDPITPNSSLPQFTNVSDAIDFGKVSFAYPGSEKKVLDEVSANFKKGSFTAIVGPSGAGKSTLVELLIRFYRPVGGDVAVDGRNVEDYDVSSWRKKIGFVSQDTFIFNGTIKENIAFATDNFDLERIESAAKLANAHEFIVDLPHGYDTEVGERGLKLSGGQRQRIAIARALYRDPEIMIFDEATSSLDTRSEKEVQEAIENLGKKKTLIVIAHRLSTVVNADKIYVLQDGRIVEEGSHRALLEKRGVYWDLCKEQDLLLDTTGPHKDRRDRP